VVRVCGAVPTARTANALHALRLGSMGLASVGMRRIAPSTDGRFPITASSALGECHPGAPPVPETVPINPTIALVSQDMEEC